VTCGCAGMNAGKQGPHAELAPKPTSVAHTVGHCLRPHCDKQ